MRVKCMLAGLALAAALWASAADAKPRKSTSAIVVGAFDPQSEQVLLIGGRLGDKWIDSEQARGLLHKGDHMALYGLTEGKLGEVLLTSSGKRWSLEKNGPPAACALEFRAEVRLGQGSQEAYRRACTYAKAIGPQTYLDLGNHLVVVWSRGRPAPRWAPARAIAAQEARKSTVAFLAEQQRRKGWRTSPQSRDQAVITQAIAADIDGDGAVERFYSFHHAGSLLEFSETPRPNEFHYFIYQTASGRTHVIQQSVPMCAVLGALDLDGDGVAELVLHRKWPDNDFGEIAERSPRGDFRYHAGWWFSS